MTPIIKSSIKQPFDPSTLKAEVKNATVGTLVEMLKNNLIDLNPEFQRNGDLWNENRKSQLIESILLGLPLPSFYFYIDNTQKKWVVIDGLQRLCCLKSFMVDKTLTLQGLEFLDAEKYGIPFDEFDYFDQLAMSMHPVTLNVLSGDTSAEARYIIFQRVNSKGTQLNPTEMRNALYQGTATKLLARMVECGIFKEMVSSQVSTKRMKDKEFASRFLLFYLTDYREYDGRLDISISNVMDRVNKRIGVEEANFIFEAFVRSLTACKELLGVEAYRKPVLAGQETRKNQISMAVFEMLTVCMSQQSGEDIAVLKAKKVLFKRLYMQMYGDSLLQKYLMGGTGKAAAITYRFDKMKRVIADTLKGV